MRSSLWLTKRLNCALPGYIGSLSSCTNNLHFKKLRSLTLNLVSRSHEGVFSESDMTLGQQRNTCYSPQLWMKWCSLKQKFIKAVINCCQSLLGAPKGLKNVYLVGVSTLGKAIWNWYENKNGTDALPSEHGSRTWPEPEGLIAGLLKSGPTVKPPSPIRPCSPNCQWTHR